MMKLRRVAQVLLLAFAGTLPQIAFAAPFGGPIDCVHDLIMEEKIGDLGLARVIAGGRIRFQRDATGCPGSDARCRSNAYTAKGQLLITGHRRGPWVCAQYPTQSGESQGWMRADQIADVPVAQSPAARAWVGQWTRDRQSSLRITAKDETLVVDGAAFWIGANLGQVNDGQLEGRARPSGNSLKIEDESCQASMRLMGPYLIVADNLQCGGLNVSFSGIYRRSRLPRR